MDSKRRERSNAGMSLIEVIVAVSIFFHSSGGASSEFCYLTENQQEIKSISGGNYGGTEYHGGD